MNTLLVVGASGVIGSAAVDHAARVPDWRVFALSRRRPDLEEGLRFEHVRVDLTRATDCEQAMRSLRGHVTHLVYAALVESPGLTAGWTDESIMQQNLQMFRNVLEPLSGSPSLRHVIIMQGTKAYGAHLHPISLPAVEQAPRDQHPSFYWLQEDYLRQMCASRGWSWTVLRPQVVLGGLVVSP